MSIFECRRCGYSTSFKHDLKKHLLKKKVCVSIHTEIVSRADLLKELYPIREPPKYICKCGKRYSQNSTLSTHKKTCQIHHEHNLMKIELKEEIKKELMEELKNNHSINNSNNTNSNNTINNNTIVVNNFGHEDISHLSPQFLEKCLFYMSMGVKSLTHAIHLDKNKPENHTIKVTNIKSPFVSVMKDGKWIYKNKDEALSELISKENDILKSHYEENEVDMKRKWTDNKLEGVKRWLDRLDDEDKELWTRLKEQIFLLLVNNRDIIMKNM
jgi:hypothetical protein